MRVAVVETGGWGGIAHYTWNLCQALSEAGVETRLMTNVQFELGHLSRGFQAEPCLDGKVGYLGTAWGLLRRLSALHPDVVHVQSLISTRFDALLWPTLRRRTPLVITAHNVRSHEGRAWEMWTLWGCLKTADAVIVHTRESAQLVAARLGPHARIRLIPHGDYAFFAERRAGDRRQARQHLGLPAQARILLAFGAIRPYKGLRELIAVLPHIRTRHPDVHLCIAGPLLVGSQEEYRATIARSGVEDAVTFHPRYVPHDEVADYFAAADVAVFNYRDVTDSGSLRIACSLGIPVVATAVGGFREFLTDGVTGRLVPADDPERLVEAVSAVLADPREAARLAEAAGILAASVWSWADGAKATLELYQEILDSRSQSRRSPSSAPPLRSPGRASQATPAGSVPTGEVGGGLTVLHVSNFADIIGGGEESLLGLVEALRRKGVKPVLVVPGQGEIAAWCMGAGVPVRVLPMPTFKPLPGWQNVRAVRALMSLLASEAVDLVHANGSRAMLYAGIAARRLRVPVIWHVRIADPDPWVDGLLLRMATAVIANSQATAGRLSGRGGADKVQVIFNGVDLERFRPAAPDPSLRGALGMPPGGPVVTYVGRLEPGKGPDVFLEAAGRVHADDGGIWFLVVGDGPMRPALEARAVGLPVVFAGRRRDLLPILHLTSVLVVPSRQEAFGRVLIEAMAAEVPVVATRVGGIPELVADGQTGLLVPPGDPAALSAGILAALRQAEATRARVRAAAAVVRARFSLTEHAERVAQLYARLVVQRGTHGNRSR
jgi:glycosyltransferase involved in cell wall biosynthesis